MSDGHYGDGICLPAFLSCPETVQVGIPLKCSVDSNFPAGTTFDVVMYQSGYTATPISRVSMTIQDNHATVYQLFDTKGLPGGQYKVEVQFNGLEESKLSSDSVTWQLPKLLDRSADITITSPVSQTLAEALRIEGSILKLGNDGVNIEVRGPDGVVFGPRYIGTRLDLRTGAGVFTQKVTVTGPGDYDVSFKDAYRLYRREDIHGRCYRDILTDDRPENHGHNITSDNHGSYPAPDNYQVTPLPSSCRGGDRCIGMLAVFRAGKH